MKLISQSMMIASSFSIFIVNAESRYPQYIPQAPQAQAIARAIDMPVSFYTGIPNISIPLYEIKIGSFSLPISISYHSGGIFVNQEATEVGLGWTLNAGGTITRTVQCADDFLEHPVECSTFNKGYFGYKEDWKGTESDWLNFFYEPNQSLYNLPPEITGLPESPVLIRDVEPDIYFFQIPSASGKMWFGHKQEAHYVDPSLNIKAQIIGDNNFEIIDSEGNLYVFDKKERTRRFSYGGGDFVGDFGVNSTKGGFDFIEKRCVKNGFKETADYASSWKLSKIITLHSDTISFFYEQEEYQLPVQVQARTNRMVERSGDFQKSSLKELKLRAFENTCSKHYIRGFG